jgi:hypothetical protein
LHLRHLAARRAGTCRPQTDAAAPIEHVDPIVATTAIEKTGAAFDWVQSLAIGAI